MSPIEYWDYKQELPGSLTSSLVVDWCFIVLLCQSTLSVAAKSWDDAVKKAALNTSVQVSVIDT